MNKLTATIGTKAIIDNPDLTAWVLSGWALIESVSIGQAQVIKVR